MHLRNTVIYNSIERERERKSVYKFGEIFFLFEIMKNEPLYLPKGSVQAILALSTSTFIFTALFYKISLPEYVVVTWAGMIGLYFGNRGNTNQEKKDE